MKNKYIIDTSIWIEYFKKSNKKIESFIDDNIGSDNIFITGPILTELLQGIRNEKEKLILTSCIDAISFIDIEKEHWVKAGNLSNNLRMKGLTIPLSDILIATIALDKNLGVFTLDDHFKKIKGLNLKKIIE